MGWGSARVDDEGQAFEVFVTERFVAVGLVGGEEECVAGREFEVALLQTEPQAASLDVELLVAPGGVGPCGFLGAGREAQFVELHALAAELREEGAAAEAAVFREEVAGLRGAFEAHGGGGLVVSEELGEGDL